MSVGISCVVLPKSLGIGISCVDLPKILGTIGVGVSVGTIGVGVSVGIGVGGSVGTEAVVGCLDKIGVDISVGTEALLGCLETKQYSAAWTQRTWVRGHKAFGRLDTKCSALGFGCSG